MPSTRERFYVEKLLPEVEWRTRVVSEFEFIPAEHLPWRLLHKYRYFMIVSGSISHVFKSWGHNQSVHFHLEHIGGAQIESESLQMTSYVSSWGNELTELFHFPPKIMFMTIDCEKEPVNFKYWGSSYYTVRVGMKLRMVVIASNSPFDFSSLTESPDLPDEDIFDT